LNPVPRQVKAIVNEELNTLVKLYPYNIRSFSDPVMLHASSMFLFHDGNSSLDESFYSKLLNLMAGMEILALGVRMHSFNPDDFALLVKDIKSVQGDNNKSTEKNTGKYTLDLLFGDIFYSRASVYIMKYCDHELFNTILDSLKSVHKNKLLLHQELVEIIKTNKINNETSLKNKIILFVSENEVSISGINSLLKTSFFTGWAIFSGFNNISLPYSIINDFVLLKTFNDLDNFFEKLPGELSFLKKIDFIQNRKKAIRERLVQRIGYLRPEWLITNLFKLYKLYSAGKV
jgi:uncharacterized protein YlbG (UPF0298 family)